MFIVEKLRFDDLTQLLTLTSSQTSNVTLIAKRSPVLFEENYILSEQFLIEPQTITLKLNNEDLNEIKSRVNDKNSLQLVAKNLSGVIGFIDLLLENNNAKIRWLIINDEYKGKGVDVLLIRRAISYCRFHGIKTMSVDVWNKNFLTYDFYRKMGFEVEKLMNINTKEEVANDFTLHLVLRLD
ncbi:MAG: GNAT family N-acetyltransferase [archaeon GB-1867-035]|nr:GNAT family N-acetyltransferase [Candidatus Culexmicrobium profundum]